TGAHARRAECRRDHGSARDRHAAAVDRRRDPLVDRHRRLVGSSDGLAVARSRADGGRIVRRARHRRQSVRGAQFAGRSGVRWQHIPCARRAPLSAVRRFAAVARVSAVAALRDSGASRSRDRSRRDLSEARVADDCRDRSLTGGALRLAVNTSASLWPNVALAAAVAVVLTAMIWFRLDRRFAITALVAGFLAQAVCIAAGSNANPHLVATLLAAHVIVLLMLFATAWITERHGAVALASITTAVCVVAARTDVPAQDLTFAGIVYALFLAYPLLLGQRAKASLYPYLAPVLASAMFFACARESLVQAGFKPYIGALPLFQAALLLVLLVRLLQLERDLERMLSRLALVAGSALAFITIAIPLQLDKEWITIGWALEGAALVWLFRRIPHRGLLL